MGTGVGGFRWGVVVVRLLIIKVLESPPTNEWCNQNNLERYCSNYKQRDNARLHVFQEGRNPRKR